MADLDGLIVRVEPDADGDLDDLMDAAGRLRAELLELDVPAVDPVDDETAPDHAKGLATLAGWLVVQFGSIEGLKAVVSAIRSWTTRTNRQVEISYGGDVLKVTGATSEQQEKIIDAWLARHAAGT